MMKGRRRRRNGRRRMRRGGRRSSSSRGGGGGGGGGPQGARANGERQRKPTEADQAAGDEGEDLEHTLIRISLQKNVDGDIVGVSFF